MIQSGLVSITFRKKSAEEVLGLAAQAELKAIEWGGDIHVPHGDILRARSVAKMTMEQGLVVSAYGSYYRVGHPQSALGTEGKSVPFEAIVETATELGASKIRVWAGREGSDTASAEYTTQVIQDARRIAEVAHAAGIKIAFEYHGNTLTDTGIAAKQLLESVAHPAAISFWQPRRIGTMENDLAGISAVEPWLSDIHVFSWHPITAERLPLAQRANDWQKYLKKLNQVSGDRFALLEFVQDDSSASFLRDAAALKSWLEE